MKRFIFIFSASLIASLSLPVLAQDASQPAKSDPTASAPAQPQATLSSQEAAPGAQSTQSAAASTPTPASKTADVPPDLKPAPLDQPITLIPETVPDNKKSDKSASADTGAKGDKKNLKKKEDLSADAVKRKIHLREVKNQALKDDRIMAEWETAQAAKTDLEKRNGMKRYYNDLFDRMLKIDPGLKEEIETSRKMHVGRYNQNRVRPAGEPLNLNEQ